MASIQSLTEALAPVTLTDDEVGAILDGASTSVSPVLEERRFVADVGVASVAI